MSCHDYLVSQNVCIKLIWRKQSRHKQPSCPSHHYRNKEKSNSGITCPDYPVKQNVCIKLTFAIDFSANINFCCAQQKYVVLVQGSSIKI